MTDKDSPEQKTDSKSTTKVSTKKAASKKFASKSSVSKEPARPAVTKKALSSIKSVLDKMKKERESRDQQLAQQMLRVREGFSLILDQVDNRDSRRDEDMTKLFDGLGAAFVRADTASREREERNARMIDQLSESIMRDHEASLKEVHEQEVLADKKIGYLSQKQEQRSRRHTGIDCCGLYVLCRDDYGRSDDQYVEGHATYHRVSQ